MIDRQGRSGSDHAAAIISSVALACIGAMMVTAIITGFLPLPPITRLVITVINKPVVNGDLHIMVDYCKRADTVPHEVRWALLDGVAIILPSYVVTLPKGCHVITIAMPINRSVAAGVYSLQVTGIYELWPWRSSVVTRQSAPFRLLPEVDGK